MYLNLHFIVRQWLYNALNKAVDENSLPTKVFLSFARIAKPSNSSYRVFQFPPPVGATKTSPSIGSPKMVSTSCRVIDISPCGRWNV